MDDARERSDEAVERQLANYEGEYLYHATRMRLEGDAGSAAMAWSLAHAVMNVYRWLGMNAEAMAWQTRAEAADLLAGDLQDEHRMLWEQQR